MQFKSNKKPDVQASYLSDKADQQKRDEMGKAGKKLTKNQQAAIAKSKNNINKKLGFDMN